MRIISGIFKGKKILEPKDIKTRPLKDLTKESIFNIITHSRKFSTKIKNSEILDLFSGTGSFGIECLSREAENVFFVENYPGILSVLKKNLENLKKLNNYKIYEKDVLLSLKLNTFKKKFDIIFLDPPYKQSDLNNLINLIIENKLLKNNGIIIIHRHKKDNLKITHRLNILDSRNYEISKIIIGN